MNKNLTLSLDEALLDQVKLIAAGKRTSVNALARGFFESLVEKERNIDEARESLLRLAREKAGDMGTRTWNRGALYDR